MPLPSDMQQAFVAALRDPRAPAPAGVTGRNGGPPGGRFDVYRNNVHASLVDVLAARYPVTERLVGREFFRAMARAFVSGALPRSPVLIEYGGDFPAFIEGFTPAAALPFLADVARLEWAWHEAYHAADAEPVDPERLARGWRAGREQRLTDMRLIPHPSLRVVRSAWPVLAIWWTNTHDEAVRRIDLTVGGDDVLVLRPRWEVGLQRLPAGGAALVEALAAGEGLGNAADRAAASDTAFDLSTSLRQLIGAGAIVGIHEPPCRECPQGDPA